MNFTHDVLEVVNKAVNENSTYVSDFAQYKQIDKWEDITETQQGDCEDYGIGKLRKLLALGWSKADLKLAIVGVENPAGDHGVLCARDKGKQWWVLDNRFPFVMAPEQVGYTWVEWGIGKHWTEVHIKDA